MGPLAILVVARKALKHWQALPDREREELRASADRVRALGTELVAARRGAGKERSAETTSGFEEFDEARDNSGQGRTLGPRPPAVIVADLRSAVFELGAAAAPSASQMSGRSKAARMGTRVAQYGRGRQRQEDTLAPAPFVAPTAQLEGGEGVASWTDVRDWAETVWSGERLNENLTMFNVEARQGRRKQKVALRHELIEPDLHMLQVESAFALVSEVPLAAVVARVGQLMIGSLGYAPAEGDGILTLVSKVPLPIIDVDQKVGLGMLVQLLANGADTLEEEYGAVGLDRF